MIGHVVRDRLRPGEKKKQPLRLPKVHYWPLSEPEALCGRAFSSMVRSTDMERVNCRSCKQVAEALKKEAVT